jgi:hypothetical protein
MALLVLQAQTPAARKIQALSNVMEHVLLRHPQIPPATVRLVPLPQTPAVKPTLELSDAVAHVPFQRRLILVVDPCVPITMVSTVLQV